MQPKLIRGTMPSMPRAAKTARNESPPAPAVRGNNYILIIFDSCRYDTLVEAKPRTICKLGPLEQRWSYASWTAPSHYNLLSGLLPHHNPKQVFASDYYKKDFLQVHGAARHRRGRLQIPHPQALLPGVSERVARLPHPRHGVAAGAESAYHTQPRIRHLSPDGPAQRHARHGPGNAVPRGPSVVLRAERRRNALSVRPARRASRELAAHQRRSRRVQAPRR